ncbi:hypothetical protein [Spirosoma horti]
MIEQKITRISYSLIVVLFAISFPIFWGIGKDIIGFNTDIDKDMGLFSLLCSGPLLLVYSVFTYFLDYSIKGKKAIAIISLLVGFLWLGYLLKALFDGEFV